MSLIQTLAVWALPVLLALTLHEAAHAFAAFRLGDDTAYLQGRLTLNPLPHIDPVGTVLVPAAILTISSLAGGGLLFGWAKPVPVNTNRLGQPTRDMALVAAAGPGSNLVQALIWALLMRLGLGLQADGVALGMPLTLMAEAGILFNLILLILNLLPLPPLDGSRIMHALLPWRWRGPYLALEPWGLPILLIALVTGLLGLVLWPPLHFLYGLLIANLVL